MKVTINEADERGAPPGVTWDQVPVGSPFYDAANKSYGIKANATYGTEGVYLPGGGTVIAADLMRLGDVFHLPTEYDGIGLVKSGNGFAISGFAIEKQDVAVTWDELRVDDLFVSVASGHVYRVLTRDTALNLGTGGVYESRLSTTALRRPRGPITITLTPT